MSPVEHVTGRTCKVLYNSIPEIFYFLQILKINLRPQKQITSYWVISYLFITGRALYNLIQIARPLKERS